MLGSLTEAPGCTTGACKRVLQVLGLSNHGWGFRDHDSKSRAWGSTCGIQDLILRTWKKELPASAPAGGRLWGCALSMLRSMLCSCTGTCEPRQAALKTLREPGQASEVQGLHSSHWWEASGPVEG